jgi:hypothetical protein
MKALERSAWDRAAQHHRSDNKSKKSGCRSHKERMLLWSHGMVKFQVLTPAS